MIGTSLNQYRITASIGTGGMGEVFRARDTRLNRDVAIKVLPKDCVADADRLRRFEQEAKTLAALNHPNVLTIHDAGVHEGAPYLVSELLEGRTLREEMNGGALAVRKATEYALQMAHGLAAAHGKGVIHRDLKPENIFVTKDGRVKILDFGLAKLKQTPRPSAVGRARENDPAATIRIDAETRSNTTEPGMVLGTPAYMSPEQVRGEPADHRADIFAFGAVLYEMLSGTQAFRRDTPVASMNAVLSEEPLALSGSTIGVPPALERVALRCLEKSPERRFQSASDLAFAIENAASGSTMNAGRQAPPLGATWRPALPWAVAGVFLAALVFVLIGGKRGGDSPGKAGMSQVRRFELSLGTPAKASLPAASIYPSLSPDGQKIVYANADGLWLRWLDRLGAPVALAKGDNIVSPFWSPQSTDIAYFDGPILMRVSTSGTRPVTLAALPGNVSIYEPSGAWLGEDRVIATTGDPALYEVPARGGKVTTALAGGEGETSFNSATVLPGGRGVLFTLTRSKPPRALALWTADGKRKVIREIPDIRLISMVVSRTGHVLFDRWDGTRGVWALPFSLEHLVVTGEPLPVS